MKKDSRTGRVDTTDRTIRRCFLEMLRKQPVENINVGKLCEKAGINRSTFYRHYADIYALLDSIVDECFEELFRMPVSSRELCGDFEELGYARILRVCEIAEKKKGLYKMLLFGRTNTGLMEKITEAIYSFYVGKHEDSSYLPAEDIGLHYRYLASGVMGIWSAWIKDDCRMPKEAVAGVVKEQISAFFAKMNELYWPPEKQ